MPKWHPHLAEAVVRDSVSVHDRCAATCHHRPHPPAVVQDGQLERCAGAAVKLLDVCLLREFRTT